MRKLLKKFKSTPVVHVIRLSGVIAESGRLGSNALNDATLAPLIERAFLKGKPKAIALALNSPGGSPVQSALIAGRIRRLSIEKNIPVYAFCEDVAASGGYWLACAADEIYADQNSIIGSIGVISASFGFHQFLEKQGVERRVHTAGTDKSMLDPFRPERSSDVKRLKALQKKIHESFIVYVKERRGTQLKNDKIFTGDVWIGQDAVQNGLIDGLDHMTSKMQALFGKDVRLIPFEQKKSFFKKLGFGTSTDIMATLEERLFWSHYGV